MRRAERQKGARTLRGCGWVAMGLCLMAMAGCRPGGDVDVSSSTFLIYTIDDNSGEYRLKREKITTLQNVRQVDGEIVEMRGGGELTSGIEGDPETREEWEQALIIADSSAPSIEYTVEDDGTVVPWDFDSAMMLTVYHHMEQSNTYFDALPLSAAFEQSLGQKIGEKVGKIPCYYYPQIAIGGIPLPLFTDNAAYAFTLDAFLVPPRASLDEAVPIYANRGVITHEYGHAVFNRLVYNNERVPDPTFEDWPNDPFALHAYNALGGVDEGVSDIWGALDTGDPNFIAASISSDLIDRDMAKIRFYEQCLAIAVQTGTYPASSECGGNYEDGVDNPTDSEGVRIDSKGGDPYGPHQLGAVVASVFWALRNQNKDTITDDAWGEIVAKSLVAIQNPTQDFRTSMFFNAMHDLLPAGAQAQACALLQERLIAIRDELQCTP